MRLTIHTLLLASGLLMAGEAMAAAATYQYCSTAGCRIGGSQTVTSNYAHTKYPVVFAHGMFGFSSIIGSVDYWYGIPQDLAANGAAVFETQVAAIHSSEVRGEQLLSQVKQILAITGVSKVNLIGHSHGNQSIRYVAGMIPKQVASATSIGGPTFGLPLADYYLKLAKTPALGSVVSAAINAFGSLIGVSSGHYYDQNIVAAMTSVSTAGAAAFNVKFPAGVPTTACGNGAYLANGVRYYSWSGTGVMTNIFDPSDALLTLISLTVQGPSDGGIPQCSSHLGQVIRDNYNQNHLDEINQTFGLVNVFAASPIALYRQHANRLKVAGL